MIYNPRGFVRPLFRAGLIHFAKLFSQRSYRQLQLQHVRLGRLPRYRPFETRLWGKRWSGPDAASFLAAFDEIFVNEIYDFDSPSPTPRILDCGANVGLGVLFFLSRHPQARIQAFEPDPEVFPFLEANIRACGATQQVELRAAALYTRAGEIVFELEGADGGRVTGETNSARRTVTVRSIRLRDLLAEPVDFLKLDIEGAEFDVLADCADRLLSVKNIFVEMHGRVTEPSRFGEAIAILEKAGFRIQIHVPFSQRKPFFPPALSNGMDLQINVYGSRRQDP